MNKTTLAIIILILLVVISGVLIFMFLRNANAPITPIAPIPVPNMPLSNINTQPNVNSQPDINANLPVPPTTIPAPSNTNLNTAPMQVNISISNFAFNPKTKTINVGTTITWVNDDPAPHQIAGSVFNSNSLNTGDSFSYTFTQAGTYDYHCAIHPSMTGQIIVQ